MVPKDDERVVLAKGGIKLDGVLSKAEQNAKITSLFFERNPTDKLPVTMGAGIREMYEQGMDFVDKKMDRRLSMEFDWKRRPAQAGEVSASYGSGKTCKHLAFSTGPWGSVEQSNTVRAIWSQYNKEAPHCLKTVQDYQAFASYFEGKLAAQGEAGRYLAKADGPLKRLRRDLAIAHKLRKAGTHELKPKAFGREHLAKGSKLKVKELAEILADELDVQCTKTDLGNARKKTVFTPHQVPHTAETVSVLEVVQRELFPLLQITDPDPR